MQSKHNSCGLPKKKNSRLFLEDHFQLCGLVKGWPWETETSVELNRHKCHLIDCGSLVRLTL